eukprot:scaffold10389_cov78-Cyclotella_meneghiniana.AAC.4
MLYSDDSGSAGLDMGEEVARDAFICHLVIPTSVSFLPCGIASYVCHLHQQQKTLKMKIALVLKKLQCIIPSNAMNFLLIHGFHGGIGTGNGAKAAKGLKSYPSAIQRRMKM